MKRNPYLCVHLALCTLLWVLRAGDKPGSVLDLHPSRREITPNQQSGAGQVQSVPGYPAPVEEQCAFLSLLVQEAPTQMRMVVSVPKLA